MERKLNKKIQLIKNRIAIVMNRSFVYGIIVASTTWCVSLYLYWVLVHSTPEMQPSSMTVSHIIAPSIVDQNQNRNNVLPNPNQIYGSDDEKRAKADKQKSYLFQKYRKEKKFRKISQRLIDELQPVQIDAGKGEHLLVIFADKHSPLYYKPIYFYFR